MRKNAAHVAIILVLILYILIQLPANAQSSNGELILHDTFNNLTPFVREEGYHEIPVTPYIGPAGVLRYWHPGEYTGAPAPSYIAFDPSGGKFSGGLSINYTGDPGGGCTMDVVAYPIGELMNPNEGAIELWYKPHFNQDDGSADTYVIGGFKDRIDEPDNVNRCGEADPRSSFLLGPLAWTGWRPYWYIDINQFDANDTRIFHLRVSSMFNFNADEWLHFGIVWKSDGIDAMGGKTLILFINGEEAASSSVQFNPQYPFQKYLIVGGSRGCSFNCNTALKCYSGASGDIDNLKVWNYAKTDFSDRFCDPGGNIDPDDDDSQFAWGENAGWINFQPACGPGVNVTDTDLSGFAWAENFGWLNLSPSSAGIVNDGYGNLSGYAWGENTGWVNFAPAEAGVVIDPATGVFSGYAWGENIGWINFATIFGSVKTSWRADSDADGIYDDVDLLPFSPSTTFSDGTTSGEVKNLDPGITIDIMDAPDPAEGVRVLVSGTPGEFARIKIDGSKGVYKLNPGEYLFTSGSVILKVLAGRAEIEFILEGNVVVVIVECTDSIEGMAIIDEIIVDEEVQNLVINAKTGNVTVDGVVVPPDQSLTAVCVEIDIKPGSYPNCFNSDGHGVIPVAIFSSDDFDATQVDSTTIELDGQAVRVVGKGNLQSHIEDSNGDGLNDLVVQIEDQDGTYTPGDTTALLNAETFDGTLIKGSDSICIVQ